MQLIQHDSVNLVCIMFCLRVIYVALAVYKAIAFLARYPNKIRGLWYFWWCGTLFAC